MEEKLKSAFDKLSPSEEQSKRMWENIKKQSSNHKSQAQHLNRFKRIAAIFILFIAVSSVNPASSTNSSLAEIKKK